MIIHLIGFVLLYAMIIFTVMQSDTVIWIISAVSSIALMHYISKWLNLGGLSQLGLQRTKGWFRYLLLGCSVGLVYQLLRYGVMTSAGILTFHEISIDPVSMIVSTGILLVSTMYIGLTEEIVFRGYLFRLLPSSVSRPFVVVISAVLFTLGHVIDGNFEFSRLSFLFFAGLCFAICYMATRSLWFVVGMHWFWDFTYYYLGADGGASSAKIVDAMIDSERLIEYKWIDPAIALGLLLLILVVTRRFHHKSTSITSS